MNPLPILRASSLLRHSFVILISAFVVSAPAAVPQLINHQGRIAVNGTNFEGTGQFKFALVSPTGTTTYWSNDNTSTAGSQPTAAVSLPVVKGLYSVLLGDTGMTALPASAFDNADLRLRVWFNDGVLGFQQITPDQRLAAAPFALNAAQAESVPNAAITNAKLANASVTISAGTGLSGGGSVALGSSISLNNAGVLSLTGGGGISVSGSTGAITLGSTGTSANTPSTLVLRDASGNFTAGTITAALAGNASTATSATNFTGSLAGEVTGTQSATAIAATVVTGKALTGFSSTTGTITASDTILTAINKLNGNDNTRAPLASPSFTGTVLLPAGTNTVAPLRLQTGVNLTAPVFGSLEFDGTNVFVTNNSGTPTRKTLAFTDSAIGGSQIANGTITSAMLASGLTLAGTTIGTFSGNLTGNASTATSATSFTGSLAGEVTGTQSATAIAATVVTGKALTGFSSTTGTITASDTILSAINKLTGNSALFAPLASPTFTGTVTGTFSGNGSALTNLSGGNIASGTVGSTQLASAAVQSSNIAAGAVSSIQIAPAAITGTSFATQARSGITLDGVLNFSTPGFMSSTVPFTPPLNLTPTMAPAVGWSFSAITTTSFTATRAFLPVSVTAVGAVTSSSDTFLATVASGRPAIAYHDNTGARLKYAVAPTADGSGTWTTVDIGGTPGGSNLARISLVTIGGTPFISYRASSLTLARASSADGSGTWTNITVPGAGLGNHASLAEVDGKPAIAYSNGGGSNLRYAFNSAADGSGTWTVVVVDNNNGSGIHTSLAVVDGLPAISYRDSANNLAFVRATTANGSAWGTPISLGPIGAAGGWTSLKIVDGRPAISYYDAVTGDLDYIRAADATGTTWQAPVIIDSTGTVGTYTSLAIVNGRPAISYHDQTGTNLKFAHASTVDGSGTWATATVESTGNVGQSTSLAVVNGSPAISYFDNTNSVLKYSSIPVLNWSASEFGTAGPIASTSFIGNGSFLTNLNGSSLTAGTVGSPQITDLSIVNADVSASAAIADTKLATISTAGKVANSATTGTATNTPSTLVLRDASGNFAAGSITGTFVGNGAGLTGVTASSVLLGSVIAPPIRPVVAWGNNDDGQTSVPTTIINANTAAIAAGGGVGVALLKTGTVVQWGTGTALPGGLANVTHIAAGAAHRLARKSDGTVTAWGENTFGQSTVPGGLTTATNVAAGEKHSLALRADGTVLAWGDNSFTQTTVPGTVTNVTAIAAGYDHNLALKADGTVVAWGRNDSGQVTGTRPILGTILGIIDATRYRLSKNLAAGTANLFYNGVAGPSSTSDGSDIVVADTTTLAAGMIVSAPGIVGPAGLTNVVAIAAGAYHSLAVKSDGTVVAWGWDGGGQVSGAAGLTGISKVAGGYAFSLALKNDGTLVAFGDNTDGQLNIAAEAVNVTAIAAGPSHALALRADLIPAQVARLDQDNVFTGKVGIRRVAAANTLEVEGQASKTTAGNWLANSDRRIKDNVKPITGALEKLSQVRLVDFNYTPDYIAAHPGIEDKRYLNVIAQEFAEVFPEEVKSSGETLSDGSPILQVDTYPLTIYSAAAVQELAKENAALKKQLADQESRLKKLEALIK